MKKILALVALTIFLGATSIQAQETEIFNLKQEEISKITIRIDKNTQVYNNDNQDQLGKNKFDAVFTYFVIAGDMLKNDEVAQKIKNQLIQPNQQNQQVQQIQQTQNEIDIDFTRHGLKITNFEQAIAKLIKVNALNSFVAKKDIMSDLQDKARSNNKFYPTTCIRRTTNEIKNKRITKPGFLRKCVKVAAIGLLITTGIVVLSSDMAQPLRDKACECFAYLMEKAPELLDNVKQTAICLKNEYENISYDSVKDFGISAWNITKECAVESFKKPEIIVEWKWYNPWTWGS